MESLKSFLLLSFFIIISNIYADKTINNSNSFKLWYSTPARNWESAFPIGNGRLGALIRGQTHHEVILLGESSFWSGEKSMNNCNPEAPEYLEKIREWIFDNEWEKVRENISKLYGEGHNFGTNLELGNLLIDYNPRSKQISNYHWKSKHSRNYYRELNLETGVVKVSYDNSGTHFHREIFASNPHQVIIMRFIADNPGMLTFYVTLTGAQIPCQISNQGNNTLIINGNAFESLHSDGKTGVSFHGRVKAIASGGNIRVSKGRLCVEDADSALLFIALATDYNDKEPVDICKSQISSTAEKSYSHLKQSHIEDHQGLFNRVDIDLGDSPHPDWPIDRRMEAVRRGEKDPYLESLLFQYGRYLIIAGSRENSPLPMHLQGVWNNSQCSRMPWSCDYHLDLDMENLYCATEVCNLSECHIPLLNWVSNILHPSGRRTAEIHYGCEGWVADATSNVWGYSAPGWSGWAPNVTGGTWVASHLWQHYQFTGDREFLKEQAYPTLKGNATFFLNYLVEHPKYGWLVSGPSVSPENSFFAPDGGKTSVSMGPTVDIVLIKQLFDSCIKGSEILGIDKEFRNRLIKARRRLPPFQIGKHGQLQEWLEDYEEAVPGHRHMAHLLAVYPYGFINPEDTPDLADAAKVTIERRFSAPDWQDMGWSRIFPVLFLARLYEPEEAYSNLQFYLQKFTTDNLFNFSIGGHAGNTYPIFTLESNFIVSAAIAELLLQSHDDKIELLPALPKAWSSGHVIGLRARGGFEVDQYWDKGELKRAVIYSEFTQPCIVHYKVPLKVTADDEPVDFEQVSTGVIRFDATSGEEYTLITEK